MANWGWDKDKHHTWYNQHDFKTPRTYRERYGVDYKPMQSELERQRNFKEGVLLFLIVILFYGVLAWTI